MDLGLGNARVVVTGGASNIGRGIVHEFAAEGARIVISDIDGPQAAKVRSEALEKGAAAVELAIADLTAPGGADTAVGAAVDAWGGIDVLVNNAGHMLGRVPLAEMTDEAVDRVFDLNARSVVAACRAALPALAESRGCIINVTSISARSGGSAGSALYSAAKAFVATFTRALATEPKLLLLDEVMAGLRPTEVDSLIGCADKANKVLGWSPKIKTPELAQIMVDADIESVAHSGTPWVDRVKLDGWGA